MKKVLSVLLATIMLFAVIPTTAFAGSILDVEIPAPAIIASADRTSVDVGDIVTVTVEVPVDSNLVDLTYVLNYDTAYFRMIEDSASLNGVFSTEMSNDQIEGEFKYSGTTGTPVTEAGTLFTIQFVILQTGGRITFGIKEARVLSGNRVVNVTATSILASTMLITFRAASEASKNYFDIQTPSTTTIDYNDGIILHVVAKKIPPFGAYYYRWSANNDNFKLTPSELGTSCEIVSVRNGDTVITVELVNAFGEVIDSETITMTSKAGFFDMIVWFFEFLIYGQDQVILPL
ncbi:MAG: hypothetical protein IKV25_02305 [Clostridia bacterium]|nr:hypothetical protein [Clostridia bacterium]